MLCVIVVLLICFLIVMPISAPMRAFTSSISMRSIGQRDHLTDIATYPTHAPSKLDVQAPISHEYTCQEPFYFSFQHITLNPLYRYTKTSYSSRSGISSHLLLYVYKHG